MIHGTTHEKIQASLADEMSLEDIAANSGKHGDFDIKNSKYGNHSRKLNGKYASSRSVGSYLAA